MTSRALIVCLLILANLLAMGCSEADPQHACEADADCVEGRACRADFMASFRRECVPKVACQTSAECGEHAVCRKPDGQCAVAGRCYPTRDEWFCTGEYAPQCGCDGETYPNSCSTERGRTSVRYIGPCETDKLSCNDLAGLLALSTWEAGSSVCSVGGDCWSKTYTGPCGCVWPLNTAHRPDYRQRILDLAAELRSRCGCTSTGTKDCAQSADELTCSAGRCVVK